MKENNGNNGQTPEGPASVADTPKEEDVGLDDDIKMSDDEAEKPDIMVSSPNDEANGMTLKRKRTSDEEANGDEAPHSPSKRQRSVSPCPPPPPPPPAESPADLSTPDQMENLKRKRSDYDEDEGYGESAASSDKAQRPASPPPPPPPPPGDDAFPTNGEHMACEDQVGTKDTIVPLDESNKDVVSQERNNEAQRAHHREI